MSHFANYKVPLTDMALLAQALKNLGIAHECNVTAQGYSGQRVQDAAVVIRKHTLRNHGAAVHYADLAFNADGMIADDLDRPRMKALLGLVQQEYTLLQAQSILQARGYQTRRQVNPETGLPQVVGEATRHTRIARPKQAARRETVRATR